MLRDADVPFASVRSGRAGVPLPEAEFLAETMGDCCAIGHLDRCRFVVESMGRAEVWLQFEGCASNDPRAAADVEQSLARLRLGNPEQRFGTGPEDGLD